VLRHFITAIDIGTSTVQTVVAEQKRGDDTLHVLGMGNTAAYGMRRGVVVDIEDATAAIRASVDEARKTSGVSIRSAYLGIDGSHIGVTSSRGVVAVARADGEITSEDVKRALTAAESFIPKNPNKEIIHLMPRDFRVDNEPNIKDPVGMHGVRLEVDALIVDFSSPFLKNLLKCVRSAGLDVRDYVFSPLATSDIILTKRQKELGVMLLDIGAGTTSFMIFEEGMPIHAGVIPIGGSHITNDIAIGFRTHVDVAERMKRIHGSCLPSEVSKREVIRLRDLLGGEQDIKDHSDALHIYDEQTAYSRKMLAEIIEARLCDIFELLQKELKKIGRLELLPSGVVLIGGTSLLPGLIEVARRELKLPVEVGTPHKFIHVIDERTISQFASVFGVLQWAATHSTQRNTVDWGGSFAEFPAKKIIQWFKSLIP